MWQKQEHHQADVERRDNRIAMIDEFQRKQSSQLHTEVMDWQSSIEKMCCPLIGSEKSKASASNFCPVNDA